MKDIKMILVAIGLILPIIGFFLQFKSDFLFVSSFILSPLAFIAVIVILIVERMAEKKEDEKNDYSNY